MVGAAVLLLDGDAEQAEVAELAPQVHREFVERSISAARGAISAAAKLAHGLAQHVDRLAEVEARAAGSRSSGRRSRGGTGDPWGSPARFSRGLARAAEMASGSVICENAAPPHSTPASGTLPIDQREPRRTAPRVPLRRTPAAGRGPRGGAGRALAAHAAAVRARPHQPVAARGRRRHRAGRLPASATTRPARCGSRSSTASSKGRPVTRVIVTHLPSRPRRQRRLADRSASAHRSGCRRPTT